MLTSLALIFLCGLIVGSAFHKLRLQGLFGMLITGIVLGPFVLDLIDGSILAISQELRQIALIIILTRAGLALDLNDLKKAGRLAILMCFVPACFEIVGMVLIAPHLLGISVVDAAIMGAVVAAVSPAVIVPKMLYLMENRYGTDKSIPQLIMTGTSVDDVFVIVMFTAFTGLAQGDAISLASFLQIPASIVFGLIGGILLGWGFSVFFRIVHIRDTTKVIILLGLSGLLVNVEDMLAGIIPFSSLLAVMSAGASIRQNRKEVAARLSDKFGKLWVAAEILLFVLVGATVDLQYALSAGAMAIVVIFCAVVFRMAGVLICMIKTRLNIKERLFCMIAYCPKATVQAAIGSLPLAMGLSCGSIVLTVAVLSILITAPLGAFGIDATHKKLLNRSIGTGNCK